MFEPISQSIPLRDQIVQEILRRIESGELSPGDRLPAERDLAGQLNVSRTTVRDALRTMAGLGVISIQHGKGIFVQGTEGMALGNALWAPFAVRPDTVLSLFEVRKTLETAAAGWAAVRGTAEERAKLKEVTDTANRAIQSETELDIDVVAAADQVFHTTLVMASHNPVAGRLMLNLLDLLEAVRKQSLQIPGRARRSIADHRLVTEAIRKGDALAAQEAMLEHLTSVEQAILTNLAPAHDELP